MAAEVIWLASYPRSGNTLVRQILHKVTGMLTLSIYSDKQLALQARQEMGHIWVSPKTWTMPDFRPDTDPGHPLFVKTHQLPLEGEQRKRVLIVRDGRDVCVSYARYVQIKNGVAPKGLLDRIIEGGTPYGGWADHAYQWITEADGDMLLLLKYEDLLKDPSEALRILDFAGLPRGSREAELPSFDKFHQIDPGFFHKGGSWWREKMTEDQHKHFWALHGHMMERLGYER